MAGLLTTNIKTALFHLFENIAVTNIGPDQIQMPGFEKAFQAEIGHHRGHDTVTAQQAVAAPARSDQSHQLVTVDHLSLFVDHDQTVGVAIQRDANMSTAGDHGFLQYRRGRRTAFVVDIQTIGADPQGNDFRAQFPECRRRDLIGGTIGAITDDLQAVEPDMVRQ